MVYYNDVKIGLYSTGLKAYWDQFSNLKERLENYGVFIEQKMSNYGKVYNFGLVDTPEAGKEAGEYFHKNDVDIIFCHAATYCTSSCILPIHQKHSAKVIILNLQPSVQISYDKTDTAEWLAHCGACPVPEYCNALTRAGISHKVINGLLGMSETPLISKTNENTESQSEAIKAWNEIKEWIQAAKIKTNLNNSRFGFLGNTYSGMLDLYSDFTMIQGQLGVQVEVLEMDDLSEKINTVSDKEIEEKREVIANIFEIPNEVTAEKMIQKPTENQLNYAAKVACGQEKLVTDYQLDGLTYYYHGSPNSCFETIQSNFIIGHSLLTANHIPCAGEGDLKTNIVMKICDILDVGGSYCEIVVTDYLNQTIIFGHDGPFHLAIAEGKPLLRGLGIYHGKEGHGISVEAKVKTGPITLLGLAQTFEGKLKFIVTEAHSVVGETMKIGNTQTPVKFSYHPDEYFEKLFLQSPTHHCAMSIGHNGSAFEKMGDLLDIETVII